MNYKKGDVVMHTRRCGVCHRFADICRFHSGSALCPDCYGNFEEIDRITALDLEMRADALIDIALETIRLLELEQR